VVTDTLLVDGADLRNANRVLSFLDDALAGPVMRGKNLTLPYVAGETYVRKFVDAKDYSIGIFVETSSTAELNDEIDAIYALLPDLTDDTVDHTVTLTERRTYTTGTTDRTATAEYVGGVAPNRVGFCARLTLRFRLLDGVFV
jgi:hypothetical protein